MTIPKIIYHVNAFTPEPYKGNPAGVCIVNEETSSDWMQDIAAEMNLSETAFIIPGKKTTKIRFFSPVAEVDLCGHGTLSAAHIMYKNGLIAKEKEITFSSKAGELKARLTKKWITLDFPSFPLKQILVPGGIEKIIGIEPVEMYKSSYGWTLALLQIEHDVRTLKPDFCEMKKTEFGHLIVTAPASDTNFDYCVRCFAPSLGVDEDHVTGSAQCALVPFWHMKTNKNDFISHQLSKRKGVLKVALKGDRVEISGQAKTIFKAELFV
jgi:PhzF family phenazine biosynthesis protein